jgi:hypothetical protein
MVGSKCPFPIVRKYSRPEMACSFLLEMNTDIKLVL